jgi:hypothetical protein
MFINTGGRTDTVQYYTDWLLNRFSEGYVFSRNPLFPAGVTRYTLTPDKVDGVIFCSKNYAPVLPRLHEIFDRFNTYFFYTITAYGKDIEPGVPSVDESIRTLLQLERIVGKERLAWRYDPVLLTKEYTIKRHFETFRYIASRLTGHIDRCIFSFVEVYRKLQYNMPELILLTPGEMDQLACGLGKAAAEYNIRIQTCGTDVDFSRYGIQRSGCMTLETFGCANGVEFRSLRHRGMRHGCHCMESRDIGAYDTCINGCRYCYANQNPQTALKNYKLHDPDSPILAGHLNPGDTVKQAVQESFLKSTPSPEPGLFPGVYSQRP